MTKELQSKGLSKQLQSKGLCNQLQSKGLCNQLHDQRIASPAARSMDSMHSSEYTDNVYIFRSHRSHFAFVGPRNKILDAGPIKKLYPCTLLIVMCDGELNHFTKIFIKYYAMILVHYLH